MAIPARAGDVDLNHPRFISRFAGKVWRRAVVGTMGSTTACLIITVLAQPVLLRPEITSDVLRSVATVAPVGATTALAGGYVWVLYISRRALGWSRSGRQPTDQEIARIAGIPRNTALYTTIGWVVIIGAQYAIVDRMVGGLNLDPTVWQPMVLIYGFGDVGATFATYIFVEPVVRSVLSKVLPVDASQWPRTLGVTTRLLIVAIVISSGPLLVIGVSIARLSPDQRALAGPALISGCAFFALIGIAVFGVAGRAITLPLERMRRALTRLSEGDLTAQVDAIDGGELGELQVGFNEMVAGLRERERMREVFGRHVGPDVARRAMETTFEQGGESIEGSAMFVDIDRSTKLAQERTPDEVVAILNVFFDVVVRCVGAEGGLVNKFQGDGALCIFGAPTRQDDHAARALRATRALLRDLAEITEVSAAIGVSSGEMVAGNVGAAERYEFTVIGDPVNEAARLTDEAKRRGSRVLISERTIASAGTAGTDWVRGETIALRGRSEPTLTYSL